jgi:hypothetical protein
MDICIIKSFVFYFRLLDLFGKGNGLILWNGSFLIPKLKRRTFCWKINFQIKKIRLVKIEKFYLECFAEQSGQYQTPFGSSVSPTH